MPHSRSASVVGCVFGRRKRESYLPASGPRTGTKVCGMGKQGNTLSTQIEAQNQVVRKLEEKERLLQSNLVAMDKVILVCD